MGIIYKLTFPNNKVYIGQTIKTLNTRFSQHINSVNNGSKQVIHKAINKYGIENILKEVICNCDRKYLNEFEKYYIWKYNTIENGYNVALGGNSNSGFKHSEKTKSQMSFAHKGNRNAFYGKNHSNETKEKIRIARNKQKPTNIKEWIIDGVKVKNLKNYCRNNNLDYQVVWKRLAKRRNPNVEG